jgi:hypothetical protein
VYRGQKLAEDLTAEISANLNLDSRAEIRFTDAVDIVYSEVLGVLQS